MLLGLHSWSFYRSFADGAVDLPGFVELAAGLGVDGVEIAPDHVADWGALAALGARATDLGLYADLDDSTGLVHEGDAADAHARHIEGMLRAAAALGAQNLRTFVGADRFRRGIPLARQLEIAAALLGRYGPLAEAAGVYICVENHGDLRSDELLAVIEGAAHPHICCCLDTHGPVYVGEDPLLAVRRLVPYARMSHFADAVIHHKPWGHVITSGPWGDGVCEMEAIARVFAELAPGCHLNVEQVEGEGDELAAATEAVRRARACLDVVGG